MLQAPRPRPREVVLAEPLFFPFTSPDLPYYRYVRAFTPMSSCKLKLFVMEDHVTKRRSGLACIGNPKLEQETNRYGRPALNGCTW